jgi:heat shock protein HslJ
MFEEGGFVTARSWVPIVAILGLVLADCSAGHPHAAQTAAGSEGGLVGTAWRLEDLGGAGVLGRVEATLGFPEAGKVAGNGSCNRFFGTVEISGESIKISPLGSTSMACAEAVMNQEGKYLKALQDAERFTRDASTLLVYCKGMAQPSASCARSRRDGIGGGIYLVPDQPAMTVERRILMGSIRRLLGTRLGTQ